MISQLELAIIGSAIYLCRTTEGARGWSSAVKIVYGQGLEGRGKVGGRLSLMALPVSTKRKALEPCSIDAGSVMQDMVRGKKAPILVLGSDSHWGLGILRSLGRLGVPVYATSSNPRAPAFSSKYCCGRYLDNVSRSREEALRELLRIGAKIGQMPILIPIGDEETIFVADHADALHERFMFPKQTASLVRSFSSKKEMYFLAKKFKIPTPQAVFPQSREDMLTYLRTASFPVVLKAIHGWRLKEGRQRNVIVRTNRELIDTYDAMEDPEEPNLMFQEYIPGGDDAQWMFNAYFNEHSDCLFGITGRKIRQWPVHGGVASLGICIRNQTVEETTWDFMKAVGYRGILNIGYRYDARDGQYKVLDINPRIGATFRLFVNDNGIDVARALYFDMTGHPVPHGIAYDGRKWLVEDFDLESTLFHFLEGKLRFMQWIDSYRGVRETAYFALDDPGPFLRMLELRLGKFLTRSLHDHIQ